jgi:(p)ppGpp synthase/HD superfamily hydrolase
MSENVSGNILTEAVILAVCAHEGMKRKGTDVPYIVHPLFLSGVLPGFDFCQEGFSVLC